MLSRRRNSAAFTLIELMVSACIACFVGLIIFEVASEGMTSFAKNVSINRSYGTARMSLDRISVEMQSAGNTPILIDATGANTATTPAAGIRFWRYNSTPCYLITTPALTSTTMTVSLIAPNTSSTVIGPPAAGDMITVAGLGFQAQVQSVTTSGNSATLSFSSTIASNTSPTLTTLPTGQLSCLDWTSVAFIAIGTQLCYFPKFISGTTSVTNPANYHVIANLTSTAPFLPFSLGPSPSINVRLYAEAPDYNNVGLGTANTYTYLATALSSRNPSLLRTPY